MTEITDPFQLCMYLVLAALCLAFIYRILTSKSRVRVKPVTSAPKASPPPGMIPKGENQIDVQNRINAIKAKLHSQNALLSEAKEALKVASRSLNENSIQVYEFMKQEQWEAFTNQWDKGTFPSCDSISLDDQLKRLEAKKEFWEGRYFHFHRKMGKTLSMEDYFEYGRHADDARHNIRIFEDQIFYLKSAMSANSRTVGNYESKIKS